MFPNQSKILRIFPYGIGMLTWILFEYTNASGFFWGDAGEFASVATVLGIGHAYGHPLFWLMGRIAILFQPQNPAAAMHHLVALCAALTCVMLASLGLTLTSGIRELKTRLYIVTTAVLLICSAGIFWSQASYSEVYILHLLFLTLSLTCYLDWINQKKGADALYAAAFFFAIAITLGQYALLFLIPFLILWWISDNRPVLSLMHILLSGFFFLIGLSIWIYLPVRSAVFPPIQEESIGSLHAFLHYLTRGEYFRVDVIGSSGIPYSLWTSLKWLLKATHLPGILLVLASLLRTRTRQNIALFTSLVSILIVCGITLPLNLNQVQFFGADIYLLPLLLLCFPLYVEGLQQIASFFRSRALIILPAISLVYVALNFNSVNASDDSVAEDYLAYLQDCLPDSARIAAVSDETSFPLFYSVHALQNPKSIELLTISAFDTTGSWKSELKAKDRTFISNHDPFFHQIRNFSHYCIAGPFFTTCEDSSTASKLESIFQDRFRYSLEKLENCHPVERTHLGVLWAKHARFFLLRSEWNKTRDPVQSNRDFAQAIRELYHAYECDPFSGFAPYYASSIALMMVSADKLEDAERFAHLALKAFPLSPDAYYALYQIASIRDDTNAALHYASKYATVTGREIQLPE